MTGSPPPVPESNKLTKEVSSGQVVSLYAIQKKIYPRSIQGQFTSWRWIFVWLTQIIFYGLPWLEWGHRQAVLFDLDARRFYIFNLVLYPQDFIYLTGILVICALALFLFTAIAGRLWCGYACPQTVYSEIFLWIEYKVEGDRSARLRLDGASMDSAKVGKKSLKQLIWIAFSIWTGFTFVAYFTPARELIGTCVRGQMGSWEIFWVFFYGLMTYGNAGYLREQICKYMCPYARFQSAMYDKDTLVVAYDAVRGEPRGPRSKSIDHQAQGLGACIDCALCVQVCPTGIDIRKGLQYECIGCGACVDACDTVMDKVGYPRGLVRYATQSSMESASGGALAGAWQQVRASLMRPRILVYGGLLAVVTIALFISLALRSPFKVDVVRDRATLSRIVDGGKLENVYRLQIMNATEEVQHYRIKARGIDGLTIEDNSSVAIDSAQSRWVPLRVRIPYGSATPGSAPIVFDIESVAGDKVIAVVSEKSVFLVPR
jgi:cytochrome c oxidase accessory protein FixG